MTRVKTDMKKKGLDSNPKSKKAKMEKNKKEDNIEKTENPNNDNMKSVKKEKKKQMVTADTVPCPKDIQAEISNRMSEKNERTLFVKFSRETQMTDREILIKAFSEKVKEIRPHRSYKNINYVEFETREQLEEMKPQIEKMRTSGEKAFVDYMGSKGNKGLQSQDLKINPTKLFINGLPKGTTILQVQALFEKCSNVTIPKSKHGNKSYGFVLFNNESDAKAAFAASQSMKIGGADITVLFSKIKTKENEIVKSVKRPHDKENQVDESPPKKQKIDKEQEQKKVEKKKVDKSPPKKQKIDKEEEQKKVEKKKVGEKKAEAMDEEESEDTEDDDDDDDEESEESEVEDKNQDDAEESDDSEESDDDSDE